VTNRILIRKKNIFDTTNFELANY